MKTVKIIWTLMYSLPYQHPASRQFTADGKSALWLFFQFAWKKEKLLRILINGSLSNWKEVSNGALKAAALDPKLFYIFINELNDKAESLIKFADDIKLEGTASPLEDRIRLKWFWETAEMAGIYRTQFSRVKYKVLYMGRNNQLHKYKMRDNLVRQPQILFCWTIDSREAEHKSPVSYSCKNKKCHTRVWQTRKVISSFDSVFKVSGAWCPVRGTAL